MLGNPAAGSSNSHGAAGATPVLPDVGVVGLVPDDWGSEWMSRQQVLTRLSKYFHVVWLDPPLGWREEWFGDRPRTPKPEFAPLEACPAFSVYQPGRSAPVVYRPKFLGAHFARKRIRGAVDILRRKGCRTIVLYLWRPEYGDALAAVPHDLSCYHIADEYSFSATEHPIDPHEKELLAKVGQVFIHSAAMLEKKGGFNPNTLLAPNGVDYESFARAAAEPEDLRAAPRPRIGYVGIIKRHLDLELLRDLAGRHPNWSFVMVGPVRPMAEDQGRFDRLAQVPNVRFLGGKAWHEVAAYMRHMDVCIMPYKVDGYTKYIYPLKLHEYLATGRPVVASRIPPLEPFADVVGLADTPEHWSHALQESLAAEAMSPGRVEQRQRTAKGYDWNGLVLRIGLELCRRLGPSFVDRLRAATAAETFEAGARLGARSRPAHVSG